MLLNDSELCCFLVFTGLFAGWSESLWLCLPCEGRPRSHVLSEFPLLIDRPKATKGDRIDPEQSMVRLPPNSICLLFSIDCIHNQKSHSIVHDSLPLIYHLSIHIHEYPSTFISSHLHIQSRMIYNDCI